MKLIVLNYHFPPDPSMGGMRWAGLSKYLARSGVEVHVVSSGRSDSTERRESVVLHRRARRRTLNDLYRSMVADRRAPSAAQFQAGERTRRGVLGALRDEVSWLLAFPDEARGWFWKAVTTTLRVAEEHEADVLISSGPPHTVHLVGAVAALRTGLPHVVDLRDPWATHRYDMRIWRSNLVQGVGRYALPTLERFAFTRADLVVANTRRLRDLIRSHYPYVRVEWVPNGVDPEEIEIRAPEPELPGLSISYTGTLYGGRSLDSVMEAFGRFLASHPEARAEGSRLRVAGHMDPPHSERFREQIRSRGLEDVVEHMGSVPRERALSLARASSISLVLAQAQELQVPGKIYELAALGCSMLVVCERESASADEAERLGVPWCEPDDIEGLVGILERAWAERDMPRARPDARISYASIALSMEHLLGGLTRVLVEGRVPSEQSA